MWEQGNATEAVLAFRSAVGPPILSSDSLGWESFAVCRWVHNQSEAELAPTSEHVIAYHLGAPATLERKLEGRWSSAVVRSGATTICAAGKPTSWRFERGDDFLTVSVPRIALTAAAVEFPASPSAQIEIVDRLMTNDPLIGSVANALLQQLRSPSQVSRLYAETLRHALTVHLLVAHSNLALPQRRPAGGLAPWRLRRALDFLEAHLTDDPSLSDVAATAGLSLWHFARSFRREVGISPHRYVQARRIERAKELLAGTDLAIVEVALAVGFKGQEHFTTVFKRQTRMTPGTFRGMVRH